MLATTWLALGLSHATSGTARPVAVMGLLMLAAAGVLGLSAVAISVGKPLLGAVFMIAALRFALSGIYELSGVRVWQSVAGVAGLVVCAGAAYCVLGFELEGQQHSTVLPGVRHTT